MKTLFRIISWLVGLAALRTAVGRVLGDNPITKTRMSFALTDELGTRGRVSLYALIDPASTIAQLLATRDAVVAALKNVAGGAMSDVGVHLESMETDSVTTHTKIEQTAVLDYLKGTSGRQYGIAIPSWLDSLLLSGGRPDVSNGAGAALRVLLTGTVPGDAGGIWTSNDFTALGAFTDAFLSFRKYRKQLGRSSEELASEL